MFLPSWAATTLAPLVVSCGLPPPMETNPPPPAPPHALGGAVGPAAADGDEPVALRLAERLVGVHDVVVFRVGLHLVVDGDRDARVLEVGPALVDDPGAPKPRRYEQHVLEPHRRRLRTGVLVGPSPEQRPGLLEELLYRKLENPRKIHIACSLLSPYPCKMHATPKGVPLNPQIG